MKLKTFIPKRLKTPQGPDAAEREYYRLLLKYQKKYKELIEEGLKELIPQLKKEASAEIPPLIRQDSATDHFDVNIEKSVRKLFESVQDRLMAIFPDTLLARWAKAMIGHVNNISKKNIVSTMKEVDIEVEPLLKDGDLNPFFQNIVDENVGLIRSIGADELPKFKKLLVNAITEDRLNTDIAEIIGKNFNLTKNKAKTIAIDQVGKLNGRLDQYRQQVIGGKRYRWRTSKDERVAGNPRGLYPNAKPSHWAREGKIYSWSNPPAGGHPKQRVKCRCWAEMVLEDVVE